MKSLILNLTNTYPDLIVYQTSNSQGDQILTFGYAGIDRSKPNRLELSFPEGFWTEFTKENMLSLWNVNTATIKDLIEIDQNTGFKIYKLNSNQYEVDGNLFNTLKDARSFCYSAYLSF